MFKWLLKKEREQLEQACKADTSPADYCHADAQAAGEKLIGKTDMVFAQLGGALQADLKPF